jgi:hypothetical protein
MERNTTIKEEVFNKTPSCNIKHGFKPMIEITSPEENLKKLSRY